MMSSCRTQETQTTSHQTILYGHINHMTYCRVSLIDFYLPTKFSSNRKKTFCRQSGGWT